MPSATGSTLEFSCIQATEVSKYRELRVRVSLDGTIQESQESSVTAGVHTWREPFSFDVNSNSLCEIHVLAEKRRFFCCARRYKTIRKTRLQSVGEVLATRSSKGEVQLPLYDSSRTDGNGVVVGNVMFLIADMFFAKDGIIRCPTRESDSTRVPGAGTLPVPSLEVLHLETVPSETCAAARPVNPIPPTSPPSLSLSHRLPYPRPQPPPPNVSSPDIPTPQPLAAPPIVFTSIPTSQLPQNTTVTSPPKSGVDRPLSEIESHGDVCRDLELTISPGRSPDEGGMVCPSLNCDGEAPRGPAEIGNFTPILCEPPEDIASEGSAIPQLTLAPHGTAPAQLEATEPITLPQISITVASSSRNGSPLVPSCESASSLKRPNVYVDTGSTTQSLHVGSTLSPGRATEPSPCSRSAAPASSQPTTSTTSSNSALGLSPFSQSPAGTDVTTPSERAKDSPVCTKQERKRPTIDTSCVGPRGQVRKYRNGSVPPVHVPVKLRNASLDLPRHDEYERFEPNPSLYSIAPSVSPRHFRTAPSSQPPASRQGFIPSSRAPSVRREPLEYDEGQVCLDTANLSEQEIAAFLKDVDAALSAIIVRGSSAVASDGPAFLTVPSANRGLSSRQSRRPSSQQLRADLSATIRSRDDKDGAARTDFSLVATSHPSPHPDVMPSQLNPSSLSGQADGVPRVFVSQVEVTSNRCSPHPEAGAAYQESTTMTFSSGPMIFIENSDEKDASKLLPGPKPASPSRGMIRLPSFPAPQRVSPQPSLRQESAVGWSPPAVVSSVSSRTKESVQLAPSVSFSDNHFSGNEIVP